MSLYGRVSPYSCLETKLHVFRQKAICRFNTTLCGLCQKFLRCLSRPWETHFGTLQVRASHRQAPLDTSLASAHITQAGTPWHIPCRCTHHTGRHPLTHPLQVQASHRHAPLDTSLAGAHITQAGTPWHIQLPLLTLLKHVWSWGLIYLYFIAVIGKSLVG